MVKGAKGLPKMMIVQICHKTDVRLGMITLVRQWHDD